MKPSPRLLLPLLVAASVSLSQAFFQGCATIFNGATEHVNIASEPAHATVYLNGRVIGPTPASLVVSRWGIHRIRVEMPGYKPLEFPLEKRYNDTASFNFFVGGVWIVIDALTGAVYAFDVPLKYGPDVKSRSEDYFGADTLTITTILHPGTELRTGLRKIGSMEPLSSSSRR